MRESQFRKDYSLDSNNSNKKIGLSNEKLKLSKRPINFSTNLRDSKIFQKSSSENIFKKNPSNANNVNINNTNINILMQKEREKYESLKNMNLVNNNYNNNVSNSHRRINQLRPLKKPGGKIVLDPIRAGGNSNKLELSFKATLELGGYNGLGNNIKLSQINENDDF